MINTLGPYVTGLKNKTTTPLIEVNKITYLVNLSQERVLPIIKGLERLYKIINSLKAARSIKQNGVPVFEPLSFELPRGKVLAVSGPPASGKTLLSQIIARSIVPSSGTITIRGRLTPATGGTKLFMEEGSLLSNIFYVAAMCGASKNEIAGYINQILDWAELKSFTKIKIYNLEIIQKLNLLLSIILHLPGDIILIDGLFNHIDIFNQEKLRSSLNEMRNQGKGIILTSRRTSTLHSLIDEEVKLIPNQELYKKMQLERDDLEEEEEEEEM